MAKHEDRWAAAEQHLHEGEVHLAQLKAVITEMMRHDRAAAGLLAASVLVPLRRGMTEMRGRLTTLRVDRAMPHQGLLTPAAVCRFRIKD